MVDGGDTSASQTVGIADLRRARLLDPEWLVSQLDLVSAALLVAVVAGIAATIAEIAGFYGPLSTWGFLRISATRSFGLFSASLTLAAVIALALRSRRTYRRLDAVLLVATAIVAFTDLAATVVLVIAPYRGVDVTDGRTHFEAPHASDRVYAYSIGIALIALAAITLRIAWFTMRSIRSRDAHDDPLGA